MFQGYREGRYCFPNDGIEQERLDLQHTMFLLLLEGRLALAPFTEEPQYVLDVATGTGIWARDFAKLYPESHVIGTDLSKIQPTTEDGIERIENVEFVVDDAEQEWVFPQVPHFDYVHCRLVFTCFDHPERVMRNAFDQLRPGGWIEYQDAECSNLTYPGGIQSKHLPLHIEILSRAMRKRGRDPNITMHLPSLMRQTGFVEIHSKKFVLPMNPWPEDPRLKEVGRYNLKAIDEGVRGMSWKLLESIGKSPAEIETFVSNYRNDLRDVSCRPYYWFWVVYARKPFPGEIVGCNEIETKVVGLGSDMDAEMKIDPRSR